GVEHVGGRPLRFRQGDPGSLSGGLPLREKLDAMVGLLVDLTLPLARLDQPDTRLRELDGHDADRDAARLRERQGRAWALLALAAVPLLVLQDELNARPPDAAQGGVQGDVQVTGEPSLPEPVLVIALDRVRG